MKKLVIIVSVILLILAAVLLYINRDLLRKPTQSSNTDDSGMVSLQADNSFKDGLNYDRVLQLGSIGAEVKKLQEILNDMGAGDVLAVDGIFGAKTRNALIQCTQGKTSVTLRQITAIAGL